MGTLRQLIAVLVMLPGLASGDDSSGSGAAATIKDWHDLGSTVDGDTYYMDAGTYTYDDGANKLSISKAVNIIGAGEGLTIIEDNGADGSVTSNIIQIDSTGGPRLSGFTIRDTSGPTHSGTYWQIVVYGAVGFSFDNITFEKETTASSDSRRPFYFAPNTAGDEISGVIWGCTFNQERQTAYVRNNGSSLSGDWGDYGWNNAPDYGGQNQIVWEDNSFGINASIDGDGGSWQTVRFNTHESANLFYHGTESGERHRGGRLYEIYHNTATWDASSTSNRWIELRSGQGLIFNNTLTNNASNFPNKILQMEAYRTGFSFKPWGVADGYAAWDYPDLTDTGAGDDNSGSAGDGIFWTGSISSKDSTSTLTVSGSPGWTTDQWVGYTCRLVGPSGTMATGSTGHTVKVENQTWSADEWDAYLILNETDNKVNYVRTHDTPTAATGTITAGDSNTSTDDWRDLAADPGDSFVVYHASRIIGNDADSLTLWADAFDASWDFINANATVEIRRLDGVLDGVGMGDATADFPGTGSTVDELNVGQDTALRPVYTFNNTMDGSKTVGTGGWTTFSATAGGNSIRNDIHYFNHVDQPSFDGTTGVSAGTKAQMNAVTPTTDNVGFWVTDEGEWWSENAGTDGQFYVWNGSAWVLYYTPLTYPHPIRAALENVAGAAYGGRLRFNGTGAKPVRTDGVGQPIIFDQ